MATATANAPKVEELTPAAPKKEKVSRPRPNINVDDKGPLVFNSEDEAKGKEPRIGLVIETANPDGSKTETIKTEGSLVAEGMRLVRVIRNADQKTVFTYARTTDAALARVASEAYTSEFTDAKKRGRSAKVDPIYLMFLNSLITNKQKKDVEQFLSEYPQYKSQVADKLPALGIAA